MAAVKHGGGDRYVLESASEDMERDRGVVMAAANTNGFALYHISKDILGDKYIVREAVRENVKNLAFASLELWGDCDVVLEAAENNICSLQHSNLTRLDREKKRTTKFCKILSQFDSMSPLHTIIR